MSTCSFGATGAATLTLIAHEFGNQLLLKTVIGFQALDVRLEALNVVFHSFDLGSVDLGIDDYGFFAFVQVVEKTLIVVRQVQNIARLHLEYLGDFVQSLHRNRGLAVLHFLVRFEADAQFFGHVLHPV